MEDIILEINNVSKRYPGVLALDNMSMSIRKGEIHGICGENGAGKSTLIKVLTGAIEPSAGTIKFEGEKFEKFTPKTAKDLGISVIYQEFSLVPFLSVAENIFYGREIKSGILRDSKAINKRAQELCDEMEINIDIKSRVADLGIATQQIVEILKAVSQESKFIIMDEPTAPLTIKETKIFFKIIQKLRKKNVTIMFITHRLEEVFEICDRATIIMDGKFVVTKDTGELTKNKLISYMVGREIGDDYPTKKNTLGETVLKLEGICNENVQNINFELKRGEVIGIAGLVGAGRTELARIIFGADHFTRGKMTLYGNEYIPKSPRNALDKGIGLIPEDRKAQGVILGMSIKKNISMSNLKNCSNMTIINVKNENKVSEHYIKELSIKTPSENQLVANLSGGNQQKVVLARIMATNCNVIIFDEPTRGIDVGAKQEIYNLICSLVEGGKAIIIISSEMPELIGMADRILVMCNGKFTGELQKEEFSQERILKLASKNL